MTFFIKCDDKPKQDLQITAAASRSSFRIQMMCERSQSYAVNAEGLIRRRKLKNNFLRLQMPFYALRQTESVAGNIRFPLR